MPAINTSQLLGETIREIREQREMTQKDLADACGIHRVYLIGLEKGRENPSVRMVVQLAAALQILPSELFRRFSRRVMKAIADDRKPS
jgi:transcriptional regulator with XRE-family HTH domain